MTSTEVRCVRSLNGVEGANLFESHSGTMIVPGPRVAIVGLMHGNEPVGGVVIERLEAIISERLVCGSVLTVRANLLAAEQNVRHLAGGVDMNRYWDSDNLSRINSEELSELTYEEQRVRLLAPLLLKCDVVLDLHSTSRPSPACLLFRDDQRHAAIATSLNVQYLVTGLHESAILDGGMCSNLGLRSGEFSDRVGFTFEAGEHTEPGNPDRGWDVTIRLLAYLGMWSEVLSEPEVQPEIYEVMERFRQAPNGAVPYRFVGFTGGEPGSSRRGPPRSLASFEEIEADEVLVRRGKTGEVRAQAPFTMLMPAPTAAPGTDLFYVTQRRHGGLSVGESKSNLDARKEARAVERMMDLLSDDNFERGCTLVSFDRRRSLDVCADMVGRAIRMERGSVHRKITVVGRGDWGGDESEQRAGQRYRQVMRRAIEEGVPVERIQLFRGASLGWLDVLTTGAASRMADGTAVPGGLSLFLSVEQPHTVSVLVIGDIDEARRSGNIRDIRVAVLIEAATVEPDGASARVRIARCGLYSSRPEFLVSVQQFIKSLKLEHKRLMSGLFEADDGLFSECISPSGAVVATANHRTMELLRERFCGMQIGLWARRIRDELQQPVRFATEAALGSWLTELMVRTDILDVQALKRLLVRKDDSGWIADTSRLDRFLEDPLALIPELSPERVPAPVQPILSADVHRDNLERWVGWKRFVHGVQSIPGQRGKDLDVVLHEDEIQRRIASWFRRANDLADAAPGSVRVVLAGDGMTPTRERDGHAWDVVVAHRDLLSNSNVNYLRIQHTFGTNFSWIKDVGGLLQGRQPGQPAGIQWEEAHGAVVNIVMLCSRGEDAQSTNIWTLDSWNIDSCAVLISDLREGGVSYKLALFTESITGAPPSQELIHFGRSHCEGLLRQGGRRISDDGSTSDSGDLEQAIVPQLESWVKRLIGAGVSGEIESLQSTEEKIDWVMQQLGIADRSLAASLIACLTIHGTVEQAAKRVWSEIRPWPGQYPHQPSGRSGRVD